MTADQQLSVNTTVVIDEAARLESAGYQGNAVAFVEQLLLRSVEVTESQVGGLLGDAESVTDVLPRRASGPGFADGGRFEFGGLGTGQGGSADPVARGCVGVLHGTADSDAEQEVGGGGVHASRMLDLPTTVKGS